MKTELAIVNPGSGTAAPRKLADVLGSRRGIEVLTTPEGGDLVDFMRAQIDRVRPDLLVVSGGDGTVSAAATAIGDRALPLAIVPTGTANVFASELGIPQEVESAVELLDGGQLHRYDVAELDRQACVARIGLGAFGWVGPNTSTEAKRRVGGLAYAWNAVPLLANPPMFRFELCADGRSVILRASSIVVTNAGLVGWGGLRWGPHVVADDGIVDAFILHGDGLPQNLASLLHAVVGDATAAEDTTRLAVRTRLAIESNVEIPAVADGERRAARRFEITVRPAALAVVVPGDG